jgi:hypothetical protein
MSIPVIGSEGQAVYLISLPQLKELLHTTVTEALLSHSAVTQKPPEEKAPTLYRSRQYVKELLNTTYPTLAKYTRNGVLKADYFGRRPLYPEAELHLALPGLRTILSSKRTSEKDK